MIAERFPTCQETYREAGTMLFRVYEDTDIRRVPRWTTSSNSINEASRETMFPRWGKRSFQPSRSRSIPPRMALSEFDASQSDGGVSDISRFLWAFGDGATAVGETVTHEFGNWEYSITLTTILESGKPSTTARKSSRLTRGERRCP